MGDGKWEMGKSVDCWPFAICHLPFAICHLPSTIPMHEAFFSIMRYLPTVIGRAAMLLVSTASATVLPASATAMR
jgi:hypothetical protein